METPVRKAEIDGEATHIKKPPKRTRMQRSKQGKRALKIISSTALAKSGEIGTFYTLASDIKLQDALVSHTTFIPLVAPSELLSDRHSFAVTSPA